MFIGRSSGEGETDKEVQRGKEKEGDRRDRNSKGKKGTTVTISSKGKVEHLLK